MSAQATDVGPRAWLGRPAFRTVAGNPLHPRIRVSHDPLADAPRPPGPMPTLPIWLGSHVVLIGIAALLLRLVDPQQAPGWMIALGPFGLGLVQAAVLYRRLPLWAALLWPLATALGFTLSTVLVWFMYLGLGAGFGLCQAGLLAAGRVRGCFLWPMISGASWLSGLAAWGLFERARSTLGDSGRPSPGVALAVVVLPYALGTGLAWRWMGRRPLSTA